MLRVILQEYAKVIWQKKWWSLLVFAATTIVMVAEICTPIFYKHIANGLAEPYSVDTLEILLSNFFGVVLLYIVIWVAWRMLEIGIIPMQVGGMNLLEKRCFSVLQQQKFVFFENRFSGSLIKQANRFVKSFEEIGDWFLFSFYMNLLAILISFIIFYQQHAIFALYFLIWVILFIGWNVGYSIWTLKFDKEAARWDSKLGGAYSDAISNIFIVKSFTLEDREQAEVDRVSDVTYRKRRKSWALTFISFAVQSLMTLGMELMLIYLLIGKWKTSQFQVGEFVLFQSVLLILIHRLWEFGRNFRRFFTSLADATEMAEIIAREAVEQDTAGAQDRPIRHGEIRLKNVTFSYPGGNCNGKTLFKNFSLHIAPGEKVALVGHSGSGKTSLTKLLFRFVEPQDGQILFDGIDSRSFKLKALREQIALIPQQPELFHRSIRENITLGKPISDERLIEVAKQSQSLEFIETLSAKFDTEVGERGVKLSGGEKQRISIARALLDDTPIVVLDEATSALDSLTEKLIQVAIFELIKDKTAIVIAHRLSTILQMDRIVVLKNGTIIEQGPHHELLQKNGQYAEMWQHQSGGFIDV